MKFLMLNEYYHKSRLSIYFILVWVIFGPTVLAKNCADICGKEEEPSSNITNHNELSQCMEEEEVKNTK